MVLLPQVYAVYFKTNRRLIREYPTLSNYTAEIYQMPGKLLFCLDSSDSLSSTCLHVKRVPVVLPSSVKSSILVCSQYNPALTCIKAVWHNPTASAQLTLKSSSRK